VTGRLLAELARRYDVDLARVHLVPVQGAANETWALGERWVVRIARSGHEADLAKEAAVVPVVPVVRAAGVPVPALVEHDAGARHGRPYAVVERSSGTALDDPGLSPAVRHEGHRDLGRVLRRLHEAVPSAPPAVEADPQGDPHALVDDLLLRRWVGTDDAAWLHGWFALLDPWRPADPPLVLLHGDAAPQNVLVDPTTGRVRALLDWGDASCADPAVDLAKVPPRHLPDAVAGYVGDHGSSDAELAWGARALTHHLAWALARLPTAPRPDDPSWSAPPAARLLALVRLALAPPTPLWADLLPPPPR